MRFSSVLLPLMAATTALTALSDVFNTVSNNLSELSNNISTFTGNVSKCKDAMDGYEECLISGINLDSVGANIDNMCASFASEKCQTFFSTGVLTIPECQNISEKVLAPFQILTDMVYSVLNLSCSKDEKGNYCPLGGTNVISSKTLSSNELFKSLNETCKSKKCYDVSANSFIKAETSSLLISFLFKKQMNGLNVDATDNSYVEKINNYLLSEECIAQHTVKTSGTSNTTIVNSVLFICLSFLLFLFL